MLKNYTKEGQKLPLFGVGPFLIYGIALLTFIGILMSGNILNSGIVSGAAAWVFRGFGVLFIIAGFIIWFNGALRSDMDNNIADNKLKTDGIYSWVRNPMYTGCWFAVFGISLMWHNAWLLILFPVDWIILTAVLKNTEEKWLLKV